MVAVAREVHSILGLGGDIVRWLDTPGDTLVTHRSMFFSAATEFLDRRLHRPWRKRGS
ncbi:hypothetical protein H7J07_04085 [Mycobacterium koreense]|uniref:hypothetical protein n=1 Tax=Mycolicibacillus koreensis TaxID=1069220 RepID=UPI00138DC7B5|nr:hypothetical protein [Mycolicibacillus koreensis]MCV7247434.1 hypothetical protein [Mycolicibacillus koreensis]BBY56635.1 hypothetical protein MKOR_38860 [Mycolicibacillus koreensis]